MFFVENASSTNIWYDIALIGVGIVATLIGGVIMKFLEHKFNRHGELAIYYKITSKSGRRIAMKIQIKNTSREIKFLRDICLINANNDEKLIATDKAKLMIGSETETIKLYANEGSYSIAANGRDIRQYELVYISSTSIHKEDEFVLTYFNDKEDLIKIPIKTERNEDWIKGYPKKKTSKKNKYLVNYFKKV